MLIYHVRHNIQHVNIGISSVTSRLLNRGYKYLSCTFERHVYNNNANVKSNVFLNKSFDFLNIKMVYENKYSQNTKDLILISFRELNIIKKALKCNIV